MPSGARALEVYDLDTNIFLVLLITELNAERSYLSSSFVITAKGSIIFDYLIKNVRKLLGYLYLNRIEVSYL